MFCSSWLRLAGTTEPKTGSTHMSNEQPFDIRGSKLHHQIMLSACIFKHPMKKRITQIWPHRTPFTLPFPISNHLPPCLRSPCFFSFFFLTLAVLALVVAGGILQLWLEGLSCSPACGILVHPPRIKSMSPALEGGVLTLYHQGSPPPCFFISQVSREVDLRFVLLSPGLAALVMNSFSAANLCVLAFDLPCFGQTNLVW